ncbi:MAG: hypothetical protein V4616_12430 [Bacteroidota bacterium]
MREVGAVAVLFLPHVAVAVVLLVAFHAFLPVPTGNQAKRKQEKKQEYREAHTLQK